MKSLKSHTGPALLAAGVLALVAGCGSSGATPDGGKTSADVVTVSSVDGAHVLSDSAGHTLYSANVEAGGNIRCLGACTTFWAPLVAGAADVNAVAPQLGDHLGVVARPDGGSQVTYRGRPLYTFAEEGARQLQGDGFSDAFQGAHFVWSAARVDASSVPSGTPSPAAPADPGAGNGY